MAEVFGGVPGLTPGCLDALKVAFNDCLRLLLGIHRGDHESIKNMLDELGWLSINQLAAETRLIEAWKTLHLEDYCMKDVLKLRHKGNYNTRTNHVDYLDPGVSDIHGSAGFVQTTAKLWNKAPLSVKEAHTLSSAKKEIRNFVKIEIPI